MAKRVRLVSTAYGAPWGGIQGTGVTATGIDLRAHPKQYVVAVDPNLIPLGSKLKIPHNPFGDPNIVFTAADTGGAIKGNRLDFYDWRGRKSQMNWGTRPIEAEIVGSGGKPQSAAGAAQGGQGGTGASFTPGTPSSGFDGSGADLAAIIQSMMQSQVGPGPSGSVTPPSFSADSKLPLPAGYHPLQTSGGPAPASNVGDVLRSLLPALGGGDIPKASNPGLLIPGTPASSSGAAGGKAPLASTHGDFAYPLGKRGKVIGVPYQGTHTLGNWQSDNALDIAVPTGTPVYAAENGVVSRAGSLGRGGQFAGLRVQLDGNQNSFWYGHLSKLNIKLGQHVKKGQLLGYSGAANGVQHLHFAQEHGDPRSNFG